MGLKKRSKVSAMFSMSSMTDIIFLLLIFFMLTSGLVAPNALNLKLPGSSRQSPPPSTDRLDDVTIDANGRYFLNGRRASLEELDSQLGSKARRTSKLQMVLSPDGQAPTESVVAVMNIALEYGIEAILAAEE